MLTPSHAPARHCSLSDVPHWDGEADALIVGFGLAGACAALEAAAHGAQCRIFEVAAGAGGSTALSGGEFYLGGNGGTPAQQAAGFNDSTEDLYAYLMQAGGPGADAERVRLFADQALSHYAWLVAQGVPFKGSYHPRRTVEPVTDDTLVWSGSEAAWPFCMHAKPAPRGHAVQQQGPGAGKLLMEILAARVHAQSGIEVEYNARALTLIADADNRVHGLVVRSDGKPCYWRARKGVVLCSGGFICNAEMVRQYAPDALRLKLPVSGGNDDGSGIRMGISMGAAAIHMHEFMATRPFMPPEQLMKGVFINERGQRFINEDAYHGRIGRYCLAQPGGNSWLLVDNRIFARPKLYPGVMLAAVGESWQEIEQALQLPAGELVTTMMRYNQHAATGLDPILHKQAEWLQPLDEPPFAALSLCDADWPAAGFTLGGLATRPSGEVLDSAGNIIPGLYAAGRTACGLPRWGEGYSSGMSLSDASFFGRLAGRQLASS